MDNLTDTFWSISIYADKDKNLIGVPCGVSEKYGVADIDKVLLLKAPYSAPRLEKYVDEIIEACYTKEHNDASDFSAIEKYTHKKGFVNATADLTLITLVKSELDGYSIMPTFNDCERGPMVVEDDEIKMPLKYIRGDLGNSILALLEVYHKANAARLGMEE